MSTWTYEPPTICVQPKSAQQTQKIFTGTRINNSKLIRQILPGDVINSNTLYSLQIEIPELFSWRTKANISKPRDQLACGCCWSVSVCSMLGDRYTIKYNIEPQYPSALWLITSTYNIMRTNSTNSCIQGGSPYLAAKWLETNGTTLENCWPYSIIGPYDYKSVPEPLPTNCCYNCCNSTIPSKQLYTVEPNSTKNLVVLDAKNRVDNKATIAAIQREIMLNGPVVASFQVYQDFNFYWDNYAKYYSIYIFNDKPENLVGGHAVVITGWGTGIINTKTGLKTIRYWEVKNSWGEATGQDGYGRIAFSTDVVQNIGLGLDIPQNVPGTYNWMGGMITFNAGSLDSSLILPTQPPVTTIKPITMPEIIQPIPTRMSVIIQVLKDNNFFLTIILIILFFLK
jgi:hypothetical protein